MISSKKLRLVLGDQLNQNHSWFLKKDPDIVYVLIESIEEATYTTHHIQKIVAFLEAMQDFHQTLCKKGHICEYIPFDHPQNRGSIANTVYSLLQSNKFISFEYQEPDEFRLEREFQKLSSRIRNEFRIPVSMVSSEHFYTNRNELKEMFPEGKYLMENFYRKMRKKEGIFLEADGSPVGGKWNFDSENRSKYDGKVALPIRKKQIRNVTPTMRRLPKIKTLGEIKPEQFFWPRNSKDSLRLLDEFCEKILTSFGKYQDAMTWEDPYLFHSLLSFSLNTKMISPRDVVGRVLLAYKSLPNEISLPSVEGFIRQILGWREFMRGIYWSEMPKYKELNFFSHSRKLPSWYWTGNTSMNCMKNAIQGSLQNAYAHHIQRLMVTGNFALLAGIDPDEVDSWYLGIYIDAIEWVEITNTRGMSQYADGGKIATKPYVSSGNYISKMSNYCSGCKYNHKTRTEPNSCPFNSLYWNFFAENEKKLGNNPRIGMVYPQLRKMSPQEKKQLFSKAESVFHRIEDL